MVHKVIEEVDAGEVIDCLEVPIFENDSLKTLKERVQNNEKPLLLNSIMKTLNLIDLSDSPKDDNVKIISGR